SDRPDAPQSRRIEEVLELLRELRRELPSSGKMRVLTRLRNVLAAYRWTVSVVHTRDGLLPIYRSADREKLSREDIWGRETIGLLLALVSHFGGWPRIDRCVECGEWLYAEKRTDQKFCVGKTCKQNHYERKPEVRERKAATMRRNRLIEKRQSERAKSQVG